MVESDRGPRPCHLLIDKPYRPLHYFYAIEKSWFWIDLTSKWRFD